MLISTGTNVGLTSASLGMIRAMERKGVRLSVFKPIAQPCIDGDAPDRITTTVRVNPSTTTAVEPLRTSYVRGLLSSSWKDVLTEEIIANYHVSTKDIEAVLVGGLVPICKHQFAQFLNYEIAKTLNAEIVSVMSQDIDTPEQPKERIELTRSGFGGVKNINIIGAIVNRLSASADEQGRIRPDLSEIFDDSTKTKMNDVDPTELREPSLLPVLSAVSWSFGLIATHTIDMICRLNTIIISGGDISTRCAKPVTSCAHSIPYMLEYFRAGSLSVASVGCPDMPAAVRLAAMNGIEASALLLISDYEMDACISKPCERTFATGPSILMVNTGIWQTFLNLQSFNLEVLADDHEHIKKAQEHVANYTNTGWIDSLTAASEHSRRLSPLAFRYQLTEFTRKAGRRVVLPEGDESCAVKTTAICAERGVATCVLLGSPAEINRVAALQGVELDADIKIVDPEVVCESYIGRPAELRKNKDITGTVAHEQLEDNVVLGTLVLEQDEVDGLVSGVVHTTTSTIRPPLRLIKTVPGSSLVSSMLFMLLSEQVYVYSDRVINPDPTTEQLAEAMTQPADSVTAFGTEPRVAMLFYSTDTSGAGSDVEKVCRVARLVQRKRPDLMIDDPLQYDIAVMADVMKFKAPNSLVISHATVFISPDLNIGSATYKAVQRSADLISTGPVLQGIRKPANDLSRGALADDIVYTIAPTAIQSAQQQQSCHHLQFCVTDI